MSAIAHVLGDVTQHYIGVLVYVVPLSLLVLICTLTLRCQHKYVTCTDAILVIVDTDIKEM